MDIARLAQDLDIEALRALLPVMRAELGLSQTEIAARIPVTQPTWSDWERKALMPSRYNERRLRKVLADEALAQTRRALAAA